MKKINLLFLIAFTSIIFTSCQSPIQEVNIVPKPVSLQLNKGHFNLTSGTVLNVVEGANDLASANRLFRDYLNSSFGITLQQSTGDAKENAINIRIDTTLPQEAYELNVSDKSIGIKAGSSAAVFYAYQTLKQMTPVTPEQSKALKIQNVSIQDEPRFAYRGMMLDVCRHIFSVEDIKTYIDMLALHKMNRFHWHLTDDQGWRIEIKKYPELAKIGAMRTETVIGRNSDQYDGKPYGGIFTQEEAKEIVKYAADRYITVIPEIELPGHAAAALTTYPRLGCTGGPYEVMKEWGVSEDVFCAGKETTFEFLQDVFDEIIPIFPSEYIHIGGDECPKVAWKKCPKCQARIKKEKLKDEVELQSYFTDRMEKYLNSKGKKIIGWDEILEGGISKTATVMSWRGTKGGIEAAKRGNPVIMAPNTYAYLDYYQALDTEKEPFAIGGYVPVEKVYSLEPTAGLTPEEGALVIGVQANLWTEYIPDFKQVQYMVLPRMAAIAEVAWTPAAQKNYDDFAGRAIALTDRYAALGYNFAKHILSVTGICKVNEEKNCLQLSFSPNYKQSEIHYTQDGSTPTLSSPLYTAPIDILKSCEVKAQLFRNGQSSGNMYSKSFQVNESALKKAKLLNQTAEIYSANRARTLTDGIRGSEDFRDGNWVGTSTDDMILVVDLEKPTAYSKVYIGCLNKIDDWICLPESVTVYSSEDGENYQEIGKASGLATREDLQKPGIHDITVDANGNSRFVKVVVERRKMLPEDHPGAGYAAYVFVDEIGIN